MELCHRMKLLDMWIARVAFSPSSEVLVSSMIVIAVYLPPPQHNCKLGFFILVFAAAAATLSIFLSVFNYPLAKPQNVCAKCNQYSVDE